MIDSSIQSNHKWINIKQMRNKSGLCNIIQANNKQANNVSPYCPITIIM